MSVAHTQRVLHKIVLYLILVNFGLIGFYHWSFDVLNLFGQLIVGSLLVCYNLFLVTLINKHTSNASQTYIIYPVVIATITLAASVIYQFFNF